MYAKKPHESNALGELDQRSPLSPLGSQTRASYPAATARETLSLSEQQTSTDLELLRPDELEAQLGESRKSAQGEAKPP